MGNVNKILKFSGNNRDVRFKRAIAALPMMLLIGGIVAEIGIASALIAYFFSQGNIGIKISAETLAIANSGVNDALIKIIRNKDFSGTYNLTVSVDKLANITVTRDLPAVNKSKIVSIGTLLNKKRKLEAVVNINPSSGEVKIESIKEIAI